MQLFYQDWNLASKDSSGVKHSIAVNFEPIRTACKQLICYLDGICCWPPVAVLVHVPVCYYSAAFITFRIIVCAIIPKVMITVEEQ